MSDKKRYICTLNADVCKCKYRQNKNCISDKDGCGYKQLENPIPIDSYVRKERWYEKIYQ